MRMQRSPIRRQVAGLCSALLLAGAAPAATAAGVFLNELHYDNDGSDAREGLEVAGPAGLSLAGWQVLLYNGSNGEVYETVDLTGTIPDQQAGHGVVSVLVDGIQNGTEALALVDPHDRVVQFLGYEGTVQASEGPADGLESVDLGVAQASDNPAGRSLGLVGTGFLAGDFTWTAGLQESFGLPNPGQTFTSPVPVPPAALLLGTVLPALALSRRRRRP